MDNQFFCFHTSCMKSITARLSAKFRQAFPPIICAHYIPHSKILFENRLFSNRQLCICTYWRYMCIYTSTCCLYLYIDNQIFCLHISLNEIHNGHTICQISTSSFRKESFAPPEDIYVYIHLLGVYTYTWTTNSFAFTLP